MAALSPDQFADRFADFTESAFRLELLDQYVAPNETEPFRAFLAGDRPSSEWREPWKRLVRSKLASGASMARVHVVTEPWTDYIRFELTCVYPANVDAGEDVRILPRLRADRLQLPSRDFWLLDDTAAALMTYDAAGNWLGVDLVDAREIVERCRAARDVAMAHAAPLTTYLTENAHILKETRHGRSDCRAS